MFFAANHWLVMLPRIASAELGVLEVLGHCSTDTAKHSHLASGVDKHANNSRTRDRVNKGSFFYQNVGDNAPGLCSEGYRFLILLHLTSPCWFCSIDFLRISSLFPVNHPFSGVDSSVLLRLFRVGWYPDLQTVSVDDTTSQHFEKWVIEIAGNECTSVLVIGNVASFA